MAKKIILPVLALVFLIVAGVVFWYREIRLTPPDEWNKAQYSKPTDFTVTETADQKIIENKSAGFSFTVPKNWIATSTPSMFKIDSPASQERNSIIMNRGCRLIIDIPKIHTNIETLNIEQNKGMWGKHIVQQDEITLDHKTAFSFVASSEDLNFYNSTVAIPFHKNVYSIMLITVPQDKDICFQAFQDILNSIKIK